jgi:hypothetical protein
MLRFAWISAAVAVVATALVVAVPAATTGFPARIDLPPDFRAEGIAVGRGDNFYVGDTRVNNGAIYAGDLHSGEGAFIVGPQAGRSALGIFADNLNRLWVAGGSTGQAYVYDADTGETLMVYNLAPVAPRFINDVFVTKEAAYFTNTSAPVLYRIPLGKGGELGAQADVEELVVPTGLNGIEGAPNEKQLIVVQFTTGLLFSIDPDTGASTPIPLTTPEGAPATVPRGDGLVLIGRTLYVVQNLPDGVIGVVELAPDYSSGVLVGGLDSVTDPLVNPATADRIGNKLYVVRRAAPAPATPVFWLTRVDTNSG